MKRSTRRSTRRSKRSFRQRTRNARRKQSGGGGMPLSYFNGGFDTQLVNTTGPVIAAPTDEIIRPALLQSGGGSRKQAGGFYPSVMGPFASNAAAIAVPLAAIVTSQYFSKPQYFKSKKVHHHRKH